MKKPASLLLIISLLCSLASPGFAEPGWHSLGVRWGFPVRANKNAIHIFELAAIYQLPWELRSRSGWGVSPQVEVTMGGVTGKGDSAFIASAGPAFALGKTGFPVEIDLGIDAAILSRDTFGNRDYNGIVQFVSYGGLAYRITRTVDLSYRFQHMSNAGLNGRHNPGVNHHVVGASWHFDQTD